MRGCVQQDVLAKVSGGLRNTACVCVCVRVCESERAKGGDGVDGELARAAVCWRGMGGWGGGVCVRVGVGVVGGGVGGCGACVERDMGWGRSRGM